MRISIIAAGDKMPKWISQGFDEYAKRLQGGFNINVVETSLGKRTKNHSSPADIKKIINKEGNTMLQVLSQHHKRDNIIALEVEGKAWSTVQLSKKMAEWQMAGENITFLIGGPDGLDSRCANMAREKWSLSALTLPHPLVRVVLIEQLYRAWSILNNHPYHR